MNLLCVGLADTIYVATCNPVSLYSMKERGDTIHCMELYDVFPRTISGVWQPFVTVAPLGSPLEGQVVLHEEQVGTHWLQSSSLFVSVCVRVCPTFQ